MNISKYVTDDGVCIYRVSGKVISSSMDKLRAGLDSVMENDNCNVVVNCKNVNIIDSAAVGFLISRSRLIKKKGGAIRFCEPQPAIYKLFSMVDAEKWLDIHDSEEAALAAIRAASGDNTKAG